MEGKSLTIHRNSQEIERNSKEYFGSRKLYMYLTHSDKFDFKNVNPAGTREFGKRPWRAW